MKTPDFNNPDVLDLYCLSQIMSVWEKEEAETNATILGVMKIVDRFRRRYGLPRDVI